MKLFRRLLCGCIVNFNWSIFIGRDGVPCHVITTLVFNYARAVIAVLFPRNVYLDHLCVSTNAVEKLNALLHADILADLNQPHAARHHA